LGSARTLDDPAVADWLFERLGRRGRARFYARLGARMLVDLTRGQIAAGLFVLIAYGLGFWLSEPSASTSFYAAASTTLATILLALAITTRWLRPQPWPGRSPWGAAGSAREQPSDNPVGPWERLTEGEAVDALCKWYKEYESEYIQAASRWWFRSFYGVCILAALIAGEYFAARALMHSHPEVQGHPRPVFAAITAGLLGIGIVAMSGSGSESRARPDSP
jgi:hypothetical protein